MSNRPVQSDVRWDHGPLGSEYRLVVRNEDTGEKFTAYRGVPNTSALPSQVRHSGEQWSFRVDVRGEQDPSARFLKLHDFRGVDRLADDFDTPAADLLTTQPTPDADLYRLTVRRRGAASGLVIDFCRPEPRFLLPPGQLGDEPSEYRLSARVGGAWINGRWAAITPRMVAAGKARLRRAVAPPTAEAAAAAPLVNAPVPAPRPIKAAGKPKGDATAAGTCALWVTMDLVAEPAIASSPDGAVIAREQWGAEAGFGAAQRALGLIETQGLRATLFADVLAGAVLDPAAFKAFVASVEKRGHRVELLISSHAWHRAAPDMGIDGGSGGALIRSACAWFQDLVGRPARAARLMDRANTYDALKALQAGGVGAVFVRRADMGRLPSWMRSRTTPFLALDDLVVVPASEVVSTPAHVRDGRLSHPLVVTDPLVAANIGVLSRAAGRCAEIGLLTLHFSSLDLTGRRVVRDPAAAREWNAALEAAHPAWLKARFGRSEREFLVASGDNEIATDLTRQALAELASLPRVDLGVDPRQWPAVARSTGAQTAGAPAQDTGALNSGALDAGLGAFEPLIEIRRANGKVRQTAVRRYDRAYREALML